LLGALFLTTIIIPLVKRQYYKTELGYTFTIWRDYVIWGQEYKALLRPQQDYIYIDRSRLPQGIELYLYIVSDSVLYVDARGLDVVQAHSSNYRIEFISDSNRAELAESLSNCTTRIALRDSSGSLWSVLSPKIIESKNGIKISMYYCPNTYRIMGLWKLTIKRKLQVLTW
jgi:hypothetical protein